MLENYLKVIEENKTKNQSAAYATETAWYGRKTMNIKSHIAVPGT